MKAAKSTAAARGIPTATAWIALVLLMASPAAAQERPAPAAELAAGTLFFADDGVVREGFVGGAARLYVLPRVSVGPEISFVEGANHSHLILTGNVTFDFLGPVAGRPRRVTPFVVAGGGLYRTREPFPFNEVFTSTEGAFTAGGGIRTRLGERGFAGVEARVGWELHFRLSGLIGLHFGR